MNCGVNMTALNNLSAVGEKRRRAAALQDAAAPRQDHHQREASWSAPVLWSFIRANPAPNLSVKCHSLTTLTSPRPSPLPPRERRGGNALRVLANPRLDSARWFSTFRAMSSGCSLSQRPSSPPASTRLMQVAPKHSVGGRERVRLREISAGKAQSTAIISIGL